MSNPIMPFAPSDQQPEPQQPQQPRPKYLITINMQVDSMADARGFLTDICQEDLTDVRANNTSSGHYGAASYTLLVQTRTAPDALAILPIPDDSTPKLQEITIEAE